MKRMLLCALVVLLALPLAVTAQGQDRIDTSPIELNRPHQRDFLGDGARALGMGGAFIAVSDDVSGISWNPSGLYDRTNKFEQPILSISYGRFSPTSKYSWGGDIDEFSRFSNEIVEGSSLLSGIDMVGMALPMRIKGHPFVFAGQFSRLGEEFLSYGVNSDTSLFWSDEDRSIGELGRLRTNEIGSRQTSINALNLGFGTRLYDKISFGLAVNVYSGSSNRTVSTDIFEDNVKPNFSIQRSDFQTNFLRTDTISFSGIYFNIGLKYKGDKFSAGLIIKPPHTLSEDLDIAHDTTVWQNGLIDQDRSGQLTFDDNILIELDQPLTLGLGLAYNVSEKLLFAADFEYRSFSSGEVRQRTELELVPGAADKETFITFDPDWQNVLAIRLGTEYKWETNFSLIPMIPIRAGFARTPSPTKVNSLTSTENFTTNTISFGTGAHWDQIHLDLAYVHSTFKFVNWDSSGSLIISETSDNTYNKLKLTFTGYF